MADIYGPLSELIGIWSGNNGVNLIAVPDQQGGFTLLVDEYYETLTVTALNSPTPNRLMESIEQIPTLMYSLMIHKSSDNTLMHAENGIWELLDKSDLNDGYDLARITTVPHGDAVMALGNSSANTGGPVIDATMSALPTGDLPPVLGYADVYSHIEVPGFHSGFPNTYLIAHLDAQKKAGQTVLSTVQLDVSTLNNGGIHNIPSISKKVNAKAFESTFWLETVKDEATGKTFPQLQYSQNTNLEFPVRGNTGDETIQWPHVNVNTLIKQ